MELKKYVLNDKGLILDLGIYDGWKGKTDFFQIIEEHLWIVPYDKRSVQDLGKIIATSNNILELARDNDFLEVINVDELVVRLNIYIYDEVHGPYVFIQHLGKTMTLKEYYYFSMEEYPYCKLMLYKKFNNNYIGYEVVVK